MKSKLNNKWYAFIPNLITTFNLLCGVTGIYFALGQHFGIAFILLLTGALFDFLDGLIARALKVNGELGKQLDSLADLVTFGILPTAMVFSTQSNLLTGGTGTFNNVPFHYWIFLLSPLLITAFSALRLAKFNIDTRQTSSFIGLPTPANALFFAALCYNIAAGSNPIITMLGNSLFLFILTVVFSLLLISPLRMFSLKFSSFALSNNLTRYIFLLLSALILLVLKTSGIPVVIILYIALSIIVSNKSD